MVAPTACPSGRSTDNPTRSVDGDARNHGDRQRQPPARPGRPRGGDVDAAVDGVPLLGHAASARAPRVHPAGHHLQAAQGARRGARREPPQLLPARLPVVSAPVLRGRRRRPGRRGRRKADGRVPRPRRLVDRRLPAVRAQPEGREPGGDVAAPQARHDPDQRLEHPRRAVVPPRDGVLPGRPGGRAGDEPVRRHRRGAPRRRAGEPPAQRLHRRGHGAGVVSAGDVRGGQVDADAGPRPGGDRRVRGGPHTFWPRIRSSACGSGRRAMRSA